MYVYCIFIQIHIHMCIRIIEDPQSAFWCVAQLFRRGGAILCKHLQRRGRCHLGDAPCQTAVIGISCKGEACAQSEACWFSHTEHLSDGRFAK